jgi:hypothetical protein
MGSAPDPRRHMSRRTRRDESPVNATLADAKLAEAQLAEAQLAEAQLAEAQQLVAAQSRRSAG